VRLNQPPPTFLDRGVDDPTRILVPYVRGMIHAETVTHITVSGRESTFVDLDPADPYAYARLLDKWWNRGTDLIVVEQDMVPAYGFATQFQQCPHPVCSYRYHCDAPAKVYGLGCIRFRARLQATHPSLAAQAGGATGGRRFSTHWLSLNERVLDLCQRFGAPVHLHTPDAGHLHDYSRPRIPVGCTDG